MTLRAVVSKQRQVIVDSIENILDKCQNIDVSVNSVNLFHEISNENEQEYKVKIGCNVLKT